MLGRRLPGQQGHRPLGPRSVTKLFPHRRANVHSDAVLLDPVGVCSAEAPIMPAVCRERLRFPAFSSSPPHVLYLFLSLLRDRARAELSVSRLTPQHAMWRWRGAAIL